MRARSLRIRPNFRANSKQMSIAGWLLSTDNQRRLFQLDKFDSLWISALNGEDSLFSLSAKVHILSCQRFACNTSSQMISNLVDIHTKDLNVKNFPDDSDDWLSIQTSVLNRLAVLGHLDKLKYAAEWEVQLSAEHKASITDAIARAIKCKTHLTHLDLSSFYWRLKCAPRLEKLFEVGCRWHACDCISDSRMCSSSVLCQEGEGAGLLGRRRIYSSRRLQFT